MCCVWCGVVWCGVVWCLAGMTARLFHKLKLLDKAEELYIGALVIDPEVIWCAVLCWLPVLCCAVV
jgi:hypothetical protein